MKRNRLNLKHFYVGGSILVLGSAIYMLFALPQNQNIQEIETSHPVRVYERDVETEVYGHDAETDFVPQVKTGMLVISPEDDYYNTLEIMAKVVEAEAGNQGLLGKRMVVDVILNRARDDDFPDTIVDVIFQDNAFSVIGNGMYAKVEVSEETWEAVMMEIKEVTYPDLFYFCSTGYPIYGTPWDKVGDHYFNTK